MNENLGQKTHFIVLGRALQRMFAASQLVRELDKRAFKQNELLVAPQSAEFFQEPQVRAKARLRGEKIGIFEGQKGRF